MDAPFHRRAELWVKLAFAALFGFVMLIFGLAVWRARAYQPLGEPVGQPIPFSHKHHVGDDGLDCRYCHTTVEKAAFAGLPSTGICLSCHSQLYREQPLLQALHESAATGRPIPWRRVHRLPDFVYFDHSVHLAKGVACVECHGRVDQMPLTWRVSPLQMQWCLGCHSNPAPHLRPPSQVFSMDAGLPTDQEASALARALRIPDRRP